VKRVALVCACGYALLAPLLFADPDVEVQSGGVPTAGIVGVAYSGAVRARRGSEPYTFSIASGSLPNGLSLSASGSITGTPSLAGIFDFTVRVTDKDRDTDTRGFTIAIAPAPVPALTVTTTSPLPSGTVGSAYSQSLSASGGSPPYRWTGSPPIGLTLASSGSIIGTPSTAGSFNFTATVTDSASRTASRNFAITISPPPLTITTSSPLPNGFVGTSYSQTLSASGGVPPYRWSGTAPAGLALASNGIVSGTLSTAGAFNFTANVTDNASATATRSFAITIEPGTLTITSGALPSGSVGVAYSERLSASGGSPPLTWSITGGQLPSGLGLTSASGVISGTPSAAGSFNFTAQARDTSANLASKQFSISIEQGLTISTASPLPGGTAGATYSRTIQAVGGSPPYSWSLTSGSLPPGLTLNSGSGLLSGLPNASTSANFTLQARDSRGVNASKQFTLAIARALAITTPSPLPEASAGAVYNLPLSVDGGTPSYLWSVVSGAPPPGLSIDAATGVISGVVGVEGQFTFAVQVADSAGALSSRQFSVTVRGSGVQPSLTVGAVPEVVEATRQLTVNLNLTSAALSPITGQVTMRFTPDAATSSDDPAVQFSTGGRSASFTIPANATQPASPIALQTGSVAGVIELQFNAPSAGVTAMTRVIRVARSVPAISNLRMIRNTTGFELRLVGLSTSRELAAAVVRFVGSGIDTAELRVPLTEVARTWYESETSSRFGSQFALTLPFTVQGALNTISSASLTLTNAEGASQPLSVEFGAP